MKGGNQSGVGTIGLGRLQYVRRGTAAPTERRRRRRGEEEENEEEEGMENLCLNPIIVRAFHMIHLFKPILSFRRMSSFTSFE
jgi:hypothetical protein